MNVLKILCTNSKKIILAFSISSLHIIRHFSLPKLYFNCQSGRLETRVKSNLPDTHSGPLLNKRFLSRLAQVTGVFKQCN
ncbi:unnamed protein product [Schistosoma mattheei]|uniref:Uncharacterized protein n=1 Tax=Schistosoma mattheei TaxID=31246 RepID=A0A183P7N7_9TREM|nr:unnamed protein product [Schistosoma mattheei]